MADVFTKETRSEVMTRIRSRGNLGTELRLIVLMRAHGVTGWRRNEPLFGKPASRDDAAQQSCLLVGEALAQHGAGPRGDSCVA